MAFKAGEPRPSNAGRKPGTPNKRTRVVEACRKHKIDPFAFLASVVADKNADAKDRIACAKELSEYLEPKLSRQEHSAEEGTEERGFLLIPVRTK